MDNKREHRTPPLARVMGVGRQQQHAGKWNNIINTLLLVTHLNAAKYSASLIGGFSEPVNEIFTLNPSP